MTRARPARLLLGSTPCRPFGKYLRFGGSCSNSPLRKCRLVFVVLLLVLLCVLSVLLFRPLLLLGFLRAEFAFLRH